VLVGSSKLNNEGVVWSYAVSSLQTVPMLVHRPIVWLYTILLLLLSLQVGAEPVKMKLVASFATWPGVSQLIAYRGRIWFVNGEPFADTNVADVYSTGVSGADIRYERSLFSQDTGTPVVHEGLLYWPFEDPRRSAGSGEYAVTDGSRWQWRSMQSGSVMHVHAMDVCDNHLVAVTGSWTGQLHRRDTQGRWRVQYEFPSGAAPFSRLVSVRSFADRCMVGAFANGAASTKLFAIDGQSAKTIDGWPVSDRVDAITPHHNALFALTDADDGRKLLRFDGSETVAIALPADSRPAALHSDGTNLWLATQEPARSGARGTLWRYEGGQTFRPLARVDSAPISLASLSRRVFVGTYRRSGGSLWMLHDLKASAPKPPVASVAKSLKNDDVRTPSLDADLVDRLYLEIRSVLTATAIGDNFARDLRHGLARHPMRYRAEFGLAITRLLQASYRAAPITMFTRRQVPADDLIRWYLLLALAINGHGKIDPAWITDPAPVVDHDSGKIFQPSIAAIVASGWLNRGDEATLTALFERLQRRTDPAWLKADIIGALAAITGERQPRDVSQWEQWRQNRKP